jgi:hypothetical protein
MGTELAQVEIPAPTPQIAKSLSPQELHDHRAKIAFEVRTHVKFYERDERVIAARLSWWCDELQDWTQEQVVFALRKWNRDKPDSEPTPGHILSMMKDLRGRRVAASLPKQEHRAIDRKPCDAATAAAIVAAAGYAVKRMDDQQPNSGGAA